MADLNRQDVIRIMVSEVDGLSHTMAAASLQAFLDCVDRALINHQSIVLSGFGKFGVRHRQSRQGIDPRTHHTITIAGAIVPYFTPSPILKERVNSHEPNSDLPG